MSSTTGRGLPGSAIATTESRSSSCRPELLRLDAAFELHRLVACGPHPAVFLRGLRLEAAAVAAHAVALQGIGRLGSFVVVDVEIHGRARLPVVLARVAGL